MATFGVLPGLAPRGANRATPEAAARSASLNRLTNSWATRPDNPTGTGRRTTPRMSSTARVTSASWAASEAWAAAEGAVAVVGNVVETTREP